MRETPKAKQAFNDYLAMGEGRSLEKLLNLYQSRIVAQTFHLATLKKWSVAHHWQVRLTEIAEQERQAIIARGIADKQNRVDAYNDRWHRMQQVIRERAEDDDLQDVAGGKTGLLVHNVKGVGKGDDFQLIDLYEVDTGLLKELREHEKQAAIELEQWTEKHKHEIDLSKLSDEELDALERLVGKVADAR